MKAFIREIEEIRPIEGRDKIQEALVQGCWVIVSKESKIGDKGVFFEVDGVIHHEYLSYNSLYSDKEKNRDKKQKGYFPSSGRIRALKFKFGRSNGLFMPLSSLDFLGVDFLSRKVGSDISTVVNSQGIKFNLIVKYEQPEEILPSGAGNTSEKASIYFNKHVDTKHFFRTSPSLPKGTRAFVTNKMHGKNARYGNLPRWRIGGFLGNLLRLFPFGWKRYTGSRTVTMKDNSNTINGYWFQVGEEFEIPKGYTVYGELVGWANGKTVMPVHDGNEMGKDFVERFGEKIIYSYGCKPNTFDFYAFRVTKLNERDIPIDLSYSEMVDFCNKQGIKTTLLLKEFLIESEEDVKSLNNFVKNEIEKYEDAHFPDVPREGVVIRVERDGHVDFFKEKCFSFKVLEGYQTYNQDNVQNE